MCVFVLDSFSFLIVILIINFIIYQLQYDLWKIEFEHLTIN